MEGGFNEGPLCFSRDNHTVFQTRNNNKDGVLKSNAAGKSTLKIYESKYGKPLWTKPVELPFNSDDYSCMHPSLSADGSKLFFASDMPGGYGGFDLYYVDRNNGAWGQPVNLGPVVNTAKQEIFPFISPSGALFFTSNGRSNTLGGLDIYYVNEPLNNPEEVVNLGDQINSDADDMAFILDDSGKKGFFSSNRARGAGKDDIYLFESPRGLEGIAQPETNEALIVVKDAVTGAPLQQAAIRILQASDDGFAGSPNDFFSVRLVPQTGKPNVFNIQLVLKNPDDLGTADLYSNAEGKARTEFTRYQHYLVVVSLEGYQPKENLITVDHEREITLAINLEPETPLQTQNLAAKDSLFPAGDIREGVTIISEKQIFDDNKSTLSGAAVNYLNALAEIWRTFPGMEIDLVAHTDTRGDAGFNRQLSEERAKNAKTYLIFKGIDENRIQTYGKGESEPRNRCVEGVNCSDEEHAQNNRLEIRIRKL
ncbi:MAG: OmpA family protein [Lewinellaceae bacterium]|nr:OmpA family protein [Lewinellaceae bacterium]